LNDFVRWVRYLSNTGGGVFQTGSTAMVMERLAKFNEVIEGQSSVRVEGERVIGS